jgi:hypothetical protein
MTVRQNTSKYGRGIIYFTLALIGLAGLLAAPARFDRFFGLTTHAAPPIVVINTNDNGPGSLRQAIIDATDAAGADTITFQIGTGVQSIALQSPLPIIKDPVTIDGTTQPGFAGTPIIELNGAGAGVGANGLEISAGQSVVRGLVLNRFSGSPIYLTTKGNNVIAGNYIGTDTSGSVALGFGDSGIGVCGIYILNSSQNRIGGTAPSERNVVSGGLGLNSCGIELDGGTQENRIQGNYIGTNAAGDAALPNAEGIVLNAAFNITIGGTTPGAGNLISGNNGSGIRIHSIGGVVQGNLIGTNAAGTAALANGASGILINSGQNWLVGGTTPGARNVISGNKSNGIRIASVNNLGNTSGNVIQGNFIGTDLNGTSPIGNGTNPNTTSNQGIRLNTNAHDNTIGGTAPGAGNIIAFSTGAGVQLESGVNNIISGNSIHSNGGMGIDLGADGSTPNDASDPDTGPDNLQNFPVVTSAVSNGGTTTIQGTLNSTPNTQFTVEFFSNTSCDQTGSGEGQKFLGSTNTATAANGDVNLNFNVPTANVVGPFFTATATDPAGNTSEFSACSPTPAQASFLQFDQASYNVAENVPFLTITATRSGDLSLIANVNYRTSDTNGLTACKTATGKASERCDYATSVGTLRWAANEGGQKSFTVPVINDVHVEGAETFDLTLTNATGATIGAQSTATVTVMDDDNAPSNTNPIDGVDFFITLQYIDFLNRLPDAGGFANWVNTLQPCPNGGFGENQNPDCDRIHVSKGFFQSVEFLDRGYFAFRFYMVAFNQRPTYAQFIPDMAKVGGPKSPQEEELSKTEFAEEFVNRPTFVSQYGGIIDPTAYVDALLNTAGVPNLPTRNALIAALQNSQKTRGQVLREIVEHQQTFDRFLIESSVSIQYFGYLRRDPDPVGYQNWVQTLNQNPNDIHHMIFGFIYSDEYRERFGPK